MTEQPVDTGTPGGDSPGSGDQTVTDVLDGAHALQSLAEAYALLTDFEAALAVLEPLDVVIAPVFMAWQIWEAMEASVRAYGTAGYCYELMYGSLDMGSASYPQGQYSLDSDQTIHDKQDSWQQGVTKADADLGAGQSGTALRNRLLIRTAQQPNQDPAATLDELWQACTHDTNNDFYGSHMRLNWPTTGITER